MNFRLVYQGRLPSARSVTPKEKQAIRRVLHPQLVELWRQQPLAGLAALRRTHEDDVPGVGGTISLLTRRGTFTFVPLVTSRLRLVCHLDILFLRPGEPGLLVGQAGDIDNRLKTLFDALQIPDDNQVGDDAPLASESPFFCLLEDDALITKVSVETDRLLSPDLGAHDPNCVMLVIGVTLKATVLTIANMELVS